MYMILVDDQIERTINKGSLVVEPFDPNLINSNSLDIRLGNSFIKFTDEGGEIDPYDQKGSKKGQQPWKIDKITIEPLEFMLATTMEYFKFPPFIVGQINGKSSLARLGLSIHQTGGWIDAGFEGELTLELFNTSNRPILLTAGMTIGQIIFHTTEEAIKPYNVRESSKYNKERGATASKYYLNSREEES